MGKAPSYHPSPLSRALQVGRSQAKRRALQVGRSQAWRHGAEKNIETNSLNFEALEGGHAPK